MSATRRFFLRIDNLAEARGDDRDFAFDFTSPAVFAAEFQRSLREPELFQRWRNKQEDPDAVPEELAPCDPQAVVEASGSDLHTEVVVTTTLPHEVIAHRLTLLTGRSWTLRDVREA